MIKNNLSESVIKNILNAILAGLHVNKIPFSSFDVSYDDNQIKSHKYYLGFFSESLSSATKINFCFIDFNSKESFVDYLVILSLNNQPFIIGMIDGSEVFVRYDKEASSDVSLITKLKICLDIEVALDLGWSFYESSENEDYFLSILEKFLY